MIAAAVRVKVHHCHGELLIDLVPEPGCVKNKLLIRRLDAIKAGVGKLADHPHYLAKVCLAPAPKKALNSALQLVVHRRVGRRITLHSGVDFGAVHAESD